MQDPRDCDAACEDFILLYVGDRDAGRVRDEASYLRLYPGCEEAVAREWRRLEAIYVRRAAGAPAPDAAPERRETPDVFGRYRIERELGRGAQGSVFLALDTRIGRRVALKILNASWTGSEAMVSRFAREAQALARLDHPGIAAIHDAGAAHGLEYIAMQYVEGHTLAEEPPHDDVRRHVAIVERCARALHVAHEGGLVHRDLKPANVMVGPGDEPVVLDFGLARLLDVDARRVTQTGDVLGTPAFMAPEQVRGDRARIDRRTDVYALAASLRALVAGASRGSVSRDLAAVLETAMDPDPDRRYATAAAFADDLSRVRIGEPPSVRPVGPLRKLAGWIRRAPAAAALAFVPPIALIAGLIGLSLKNAEIAAAARELAIREAEANAATAVATRRSADFQRLEDLRLVRALEERERELWPANEANAGAMERWLADARDLLARLPGHRAALDALRRRGTANVPRERGQGPVVDRILDLEQVRVAALAELASPTMDEARRAELQKCAGVASKKLAELEIVAASRPVWDFESASDRWLHDDLSELVARLESLDAPSGHGTTRIAMRRRLAIASSLEKDTLTGHEAEWREAIAAIANVETDPAYHGLRIAPITGLVPIGRDPSSRLWEFAHVQSGALPPRGPDGRLRILEESCIVLVLLPAAVVRMGARPPTDPDEPAQDHVDPGARATERPVHEVRLDPFLISKYEMTQGQWLRMAGTNPSHCRAYDSSGSWGTDLRHPVEQVSFDDCVEILHRYALTLPTEAQWEYAARGGTTTPWWTGETIASFASNENLADRKFAETEGESSPHDQDRNDGWSWTAPVGSYPANPFGLHDVIGNVSEWCLDRIEFYKAPALPGDGLRSDGLIDAHAVRGGAFNALARNARSAYRYGIDDSTRSASIGVRPALRARLP